MANYRQPRKFNAVSMTLLALVAAGGYWLYVFFPIYWDAWTVDHQLRDGSSGIYKLSQLSEPTRTNEMRKLLKKVKADSIRLAGITDPDFDVSLDMEGDNVKMRAEYTVRVKHPVGSFVTVIHMKREEKADVKKVQWD